ncbi:MAG: type II toxin-antitoxin system VapC family toxin [Promethearchaeota archaeon]
MQIMIFIDSDMAIAFLSRKHNARTRNAQALMEQIFQENKNIYLTIFNYAELLRGAYISSKVASNIRIVEEFSKRFTIIGFDHSAVKYYSQIYAELKQRGESIGDFDEIIASIVISNNGTLYTNNSCHFKRINLLKIKNWNDL